MKAIYLADSVYNGANKIIGNRDAGWTAMTGTADKSTAFDAATVTLAQLAGRVMALQAALTNGGAHWLLAAQIMAIALPEPLAAYG